VRRGHDGPTVYQVAISVVGVTLFCVLHLISKPSAWEPTVLFLAFAVIATLVPIQLHRVVLSVATAITIPVYLLYGLSSALWVSVFANVIGNGIAQKRPVDVVFFNAGQLSISLVAAHGVYRLAGGLLASEQARWDVWANFLPFLAFLVLYFLVNNTLVLVYFTLRTGTSFSELVRQTVPWSALNHVVSIAIGYILLFTYLDRGLMGALLVFVPLIVLGYLMSLQVSLSRAHEELTILYDAALQLNAAVTLHEVFSLVHKTLTKIGPVDNSALFLLAEDGHTLAVREIAEYDGDELPRLDIPLGEGIVGKVAAAGRPRIVNDISRNPCFDPAVLEGVTSVPTAMLIVPLVVDGELLGVLVAADQDNRQFEDRQLRIASILGNLVGVALQNAILYERTEHQAVTDELTGLHNYRYFRTRIADEIRKARVGGTRVALIYLDLDNFKRYNDRYGHTCGDYLLSGFADILSNAVRATDAPVRYAGDEFAVILPEAGREEAMVVVKRILDGVRTTSFSVGDNEAVQLAVSCGIAVFPDDAATGDDLILNADQAMYVHKNARRGEAAAGRDSTGQDD